MSCLHSLLLRPPNASPEPGHDSDLSLGAVWTARAETDRLGCGHGSTDHVSWEKRQGQVGCAKNRPGPGHLLWEQNGPESQVSGDNTNRQRLSGRHFCTPPMPSKYGDPLGGMTLSPACPMASDHNDLPRVFQRQRHLKHAEGSCCCRGSTVCCQSLASDDGIPSCARKKVWLLGPLQLGEAIAGLPQWSHFRGQDKGGPPPHRTQTTETPAGPR